MLSARYCEDLATHLQPQGAFRPFPPACDRASWAAIPEPLRRAQIALGEAHLGFDWPALPATLFMEYHESGNRSNYEAASFGRRRALEALVLAECAEGKGRFIRDIVNGVWCTCEESFWGVPAHNFAARYEGAALPDTTERVIDLFAAETGALLACAAYLLTGELDAVSPMIRDRMGREVTERITDPFIARDDFWWMGLVGGGAMNNWTPWCNSNVLACALLLEGDAARRLTAVAKAMRSLDAFIVPYPADGGCDEGTSYWSRAGGSLFDALELLHSATAGWVDVYSEPLIADMGRYLYRAHIAGDYFMNFADGGAKPGIAADLVYRYGKRIGDAKLMALGADAHRRRSSAAEPAAHVGSLLREVPAMLGQGELDLSHASPPLLRDAWLPDLQVAAARETPGSTTGLYLAAKGGHNAESHNHNDVGQFIVFANGQPVVIDVGVEAYTAKTFSPQRYDIWTMQSAYHNLPTIGGFQQRAGPSFAASDVAYEFGEAHSQLSVGIADAYPVEAGIASWERVMTLWRGAQACVTVRDTFALRAPSIVTLTLMLAQKPSVVGPGRIDVPGAEAVSIMYPRMGLAASVDEIAVADERLLPVWGERLYRVLLTSVMPVTEGDWEVAISKAAP